MQILIKGIALSLGLTVLAGCSTNVKVLREGPEAATIYRNGVQAVVPDREEGERSKLIDELRAGHTVSARELPRYEAWSRSSINEIRQLFPQLENPTITMYVYPHLATADEVPVPGYTTAFRLYERDRYALPSELPANYPRSTYRRTVGIDGPVVPLVPVSDEYVRSGAKVGE